LTDMNLKFNFEDFKEGRVAYTADGEEARFKELASPADEFFNFNASVTKKRDNGPDYTVTVSGYNTHGVHCEHPGCGFHLVRMAPTEHNIEGLKWNAPKPPPAPPGRYWKVSAFLPASLHLGHVLYYDSDQRDLQKRDWNYVNRYHVAKPSFVYLYARFILLPNPKDVELGDAIARANIAEARLETTLAEKEWLEKAITCKERELQQALSNEKHERNRADALVSEQSETGTKLKELEEKNLRLEARVEDMLNSCTGEELRKKHEAIISLYGQIVAIRQERDTACIALEQLRTDHHHIDLKAQGLQNCIDGYRRDRNNAVEKVEKLSDDLAKALADKGELCAQNGDLARKLSDANETIFRHRARLSRVKDVVNAPGGM